MPLLLDTDRAAAALAFRSANCITIGLINNMPDAAFGSTERQFVDLIRSATGDTVVCLKLFALPEVPRADWLRQELAGRYRDVAELWDMPLDGLIVTGNEPRATNLMHEPYWDTLRTVVDWARDHTASTVWSCLAAHAAVLHIDGIERRLLKKKMFGVFECQMAEPHPMTQHIRHPLRVPHSRHNDLPEAALAASGYKILSRSAVAGVDTFARQDRSFFLFFQGHPEYEAVTLLREYRRDIGRFLKGEREDYPAAPQNFFNDETAAVVNEFRERVLADRRTELIESFPKRALEAGLESASQSSWQPSAIGVYERWIAFLRARKAEGRTSSGPRRRTWRDWPVGIAPPAADGSAG
jgi:homoserine O-succinyltransferase